MNYDHKKIDKKWQEAWEKEGLYKTTEHPKKKQYILDMFPYPSGAGLHVGHPEGYTATDILSRFLRMNGHDVLHPMGWDAFGLPAENYAIKEGVAPAVSTAKNINRFREQIKSIGLSYDWSREVNTSSPDYYRWTQWLFIQLYKKGLAYKKEANVNWCPKDQTVLANEQVVNGCCERCGTPVTQKLLSQWFFKITDYADRLLNDMDKLDWPEPIKLMQKNWIGRSEGAEIEFPIVNPRVKRFVILHGRGGSHKSNFVPWLKQELEARGFEVETPFMPSVNDEPNDIEQADYVQKKCKLDESTVIVGHSFGGVVAMRLLERGVKVHGVVFAATPVSGRFLDSKIRASVTEACGRDFDFAKIKKNADYFKVLMDSTDYAVPPEDAETLAKKLDTVPYKEAGSEPHFCGTEEPAILDALLPKIKVFTTRPDTLFGATYLVLAPEHVFVQSRKGIAENQVEIEKYLETTKKKTEMQRTALEKEKTGVELKGIKAINPATKEEISVWIADYVLNNYGTGAIMAVPAHDERDFAFAKKYKLPIKQVIRSNANCVMVHGCPHDEKSLIDITKDTDKHWIPWIRTELEKQGVIVINPLMPISWHPNYEVWKKKFEKISINQDSILVGHSCGGTFLAHWLSENKVNIRKLILVAPSKVVKEGAPDDQKQWLDFAIDPELKNRVQESVVFIGLKDKDRSKESAKIYATALNARLVEFPKKGHFMPEDMGGSNSFPELLAEILTKDSAETDTGILVNSGKFNDLDSEEAKAEITKFVVGKMKTQFKLRDWLVSRQRYWGAPIPIVYCDKCGEQAVPEKDLPVLLPTDVDFLPTGESPIARSKTFHKVKCPKCNEPAKRDSDTMDTFVDSSWYFFRFTDPHNDKEWAGKQAIKSWLPVDTYVGGAEHAVLHLLYARFFTKALADLKYIDFEEPFTKLRNQGLILGPDGEKMSKSRGNVVNPDDVIAEFGADAFRMYEMFMGPLEDVKPWATTGIVGLKRFLDKVGRFASHPGLDPGSSQSAMHKLIKKITSDIESFKFNTAIAAFMEFLNENKEMPQKDWETFLVLLAPFVPHVTEDLWHNLGHKDSIHLQAWPKFDPKLIVDETVTIVIQILGRVRASLQMPAGSDQTVVKKLALADENVKKHLVGKEIVKEIFVKDRLINFVVK